MTAILGFLCSALTLWLGAWMVERSRHRIDPLGALVCWMVCIRAFGLMVADCYRAAKDRLERWPDHVERARREA